MKVWKHVRRKRVLSRTSRPVLTVPEEAPEEEGRRAEGVRERVIAWTLWRFGSARY